MNKTKTFDKKNVKEDFKKWLKNKGDMDPEDFDDENYNLVIMIDAFRDYITEWSKSLNNRR